MRSRLLPGARLAVANSQDYKSLPPSQIIPALADDSPTYKAVTQGVAWNSTPPAAVRTIMEQHADFFASVNASEKAQQETPGEYKHKWTPEAKVQ